MEKNITLLKGDGIGPEIVNQAVKVLDAVAEKYDLDIDQMFLEYKKSTGRWWVHLGLNVDDGGIHMRNQYGNLNV